MPGEYSADLEALSDLCTPWCLRIAVTLGIAAHIETGTVSLEELAEVSGSDPYYLRCVLRHLVEKGVFEEDEDGDFRNNEVSLGLTQEIWGVVLGLDGFGGRLAKAWGTLPEAVQTGKSQYASVFGRSFWDDLEAHPLIRADFDELMGAMGHGKPDTEVLPGGDWSEVRTVVDVGACGGELLIEILRKHPSVKGIWVDLPEAMTRAARRIRSAGMTERITMAAGSFFDPLPSGAEVYILKSILNDWGDVEAVAILKRCAEAMGASGRIIVMGGVSDVDQPTGMGPELVLVGGRIRTVEEFEGLAGEAGLKVSRTERLRSGRFLVECQGK